MKLFWWPDTGRYVRFVFKLGYIDPKWDKSGTFFRSHFSSTRQNVLKYDLKIALSHLGLIWATLEPNLPPPVTVECKWISEDRWSGVYALRCMSQWAGFTAVRTLVKHASRCLKRHSSVTRWALTRALGLAGFFSAKLDNSETLSDQILVPSTEPKCTEI